MRKLLDTFCKSGGFAEISLTSNHILYNNANKDNIIPKNPWCDVNKHVKSMNYYSLCYDCLANLPSLKNEILNMSSTDIIKILDSKTLKNGQNGYIHYIIDDTVFIGDYISDTYINDLCSLLHTFSDSEFAKKYEDFEKLMKIFPMTFYRSDTHKFTLTSRDEAFCRKFLGRYFERINAMIKPLIKLLTSEYESKCKNFIDENLCIIQSILSVDVLYIITSYNVLLFLMKSLLHLLRITSKSIDVILMKYDDLIKALNDNNVDYRKHDCSISFDYKNSEFLFLPDFNNDMVYFDVKRIDTCKKVEITLKQRI